MESLAFTWHSVSVNKERPDSLRYCVISALEILIIFADLLSISLHFAADLNFSAK